jgi:hypothetical protein
LKDFFIFGWCWLWCNGGILDLFDIRRLLDEDWVDSFVDDEKKFIVCDGRGKVKFVVEWSSCLAVDEEEEVADDELDVDDDDVVRFFLPVIVDEEGLELVYSLTCCRYSWLIFIWFWALSWSSFSTCWSCSK